MEVGIESMLQESCSWRRTDRSQ